MFFLFRVASLFPFLSRRKDILEKEIQEIETKRARQR